MKKNKKLIIIILVAIAIIAVTATATYAFLSYIKEGTTENSITTGAITFHYQEDNQGISLGDAMPMTESQGKAQSNYFEFTITSKTSSVVDIPYYITAIRTGTGTNMDNIMNVYLTKVANNGTETQVALSKFSELGSYTHNTLTIPVNEKLLYRDTVYAETSEYTQKYRLRMWIDNSANLLVQENGTDYYPYVRSLFMYNKNYPN